VCVAVFAAVWCSIVDVPEKVNNLTKSFTLYRKKANTLRRGGCCSVLQCVAVCCTVLQCVAVCCRLCTGTGQIDCKGVCVAVFAGVCVAVRCNTLQYTAIYCNTL